MIVVQRLNDRKMSWKTTFDLDTGPAVTFEVGYAHCKEVKDFWPDPDCGNHSMIGAYGVYVAAKGKWTTRLIYGNWLWNSAAFYAEIDVDIKSHHPRMTRAVELKPLVETARAKCFGNGLMDRCIY